MARLVQYGTFSLQNIGFLEGAHPIGAELTTGTVRHFSSWPLQDIVSLQRFIVGVHHPFIAPPTCEAYPIAILLHDHYAIYAPIPTPPVNAIHHTMLVMAMSCKGHFFSSPCTGSVASMLFLLLSSFSPADISLVGRTPF